MIYRSPFTNADNDADESREEFVRVTPEAKPKHVMILQIRFLIMRYIGPYRINNKQENTFQNK